MQTNLHILVFFSFFCRGLGWGRDVYYHKSSLQYTCTNTSRVGFKERQPVFFFPGLESWTRFLASMVSSFTTFLRLQVQNVDCFVGRKPIFLLEVNHFFRPASASEHTLLNLLVASSSGLMLVPVSGDDRQSVRATSEVWERKRVTQTCSSTPAF